MTCHNDKESQEFAMVPEAKAIWSGLEFRKPMMLRNVEPLSAAQMLWVPGEKRKCVAWQLWHIAEVEDVWIAEVVLGEKGLFPFGHRLAEIEHDLSMYPSKVELIAYFHEVRAITKARLERATADDFEREVAGADFGTRPARDIWQGVVTSFAWHAGQLAMTAKLMPGSPVSVQRMTYLNNPER